MTDEHLVQKTNASVRHGKIIVITSLASIIVWLLISEKYYSDVNFFTNLFFLKVNFFETCWEHGWPPCTALFSFKTKNLILLSFLVGTYGVLIWQGLTTSPVLHLKAYIAKRKERNQAMASDQIPSLTNGAEEKEVLSENSYSKQEAPKIKAPESLNSKKEEDLFLKVAIIGTGVSSFLIILIFLLNIGSTP